MSLTVKDLTKRYGDRTVVDRLLKKDFAKHQLQAF